MAIKFSLLACAAMLSPLTAHAQYQMISPMLYEGPRISLQDHADRQRGASKDPAEPSRRAGATPKAGRTGTRIGDAADFRYRPDPERRRANQARLVARSRAADPAAAEQLAGLFASTDVMRQIETAIAPHGLHVDNVADAYTMYWITMWHATRGDNDTPTSKTVAAVKAQAESALTETAAIKEAGDATRQDIAETLWIQAALIDGAVERSRGSKDVLAKLATAAAQGARETGLDPAAMELTETGFVSARGVAGRADR